MSCSLMMNTPVKSGTRSRTMSGVLAGSCPTTGLVLPKRAPCSRRSLSRTLCVAVPPEKVKVTAPEKTMKAPKPLRRSNDEKVLHSLTSERLEVVKDLEDFAENELLGMLKPVETIWQPQDLLPDPASSDFIDEVRAIQERAKHIPDDHLVCLVGDMITEEALPTYMTMLNTLDGTSDETGADDTAWAEWTRGWTAEENRHGDLLNKYLWMTGRIDMRQVEVTIHNLISSGMDPKTENNPYLGFVYTSFQERATKISHGNTARFAKEHGDDKLALICANVASDEGRHEIAYTRIVDELLERDPDGAMLAFSDMMKKQIVMPAHLMDDCRHQQTNDRLLFDDFATVAERIGVYTAQDYAAVMQHLIKRWDIAGRHFESGEAAAAQEYVMKLPPRVLRLAERASARKKKAQQAAPTTKFSWIYDRPVKLL